jgi:hypothetical protein
MGYRRLGLSVIVASCLIIAVEGKPAKAASAAASAAVVESSLRSGSMRIDEPVLHRHRTQSFYCYPKTYWWFYRPYTTAPVGYARCMPYFHYLEPGARGAPPQRHAK